MSVPKPQCIGHYTNNIVYDRIEAGLLDELRRRTPTDDKGRKKARFHQWFSADIGVPKLSQHIHAVTGLMRAARNWNEFMEMADRAFPRRGNTLQLSLEN